MTFIETDNITNLLQTFLDVQSRRAQVISSNIANADTPGYTAKKLEFQEFLNEAAERATLPRSGQSALPQPAAALTISDQESNQIRLDGNNVDAAREMANLAETSINFNLGAKMLQSRLRLIRSAIREGR